VARLPGRSKGSEVWLGYHATEEAAAQAIVQYKKHSVASTAARQATSKYKGVDWEKSSCKWRARCKKIGIGRHAKEEDAAQAYNTEASRIGLVDLNVIPPAGNDDDGINTNAAAAPAPTVTTPAHVALAAASAAPTTAATAAPSLAAATCAHAVAGSKRAAPTTPLAPPPTKRLRLDTSASAAAGSSVAEVAAGARAAAAAAAQGAAPPCGLECCGGGQGDKGEGRGF
jgi:hypothetical protein